MPCDTRQTVQVTFSTASDSGGMLSVNPGVPAQHALSEAVHLLDSLIDGLARACTDEPIGGTQAYQALTIADMVRALVVSCAEGVTE